MPGGRGTVRSAGLGGLRFGLLQEARMYRSVTESDDGESGRGRALRWVEGIAVGAVVVVILAVTFL